MNKIKVLIVDDHKLLRNGLRSLLEKEKNIIVIAESETGKEGINKILSHKIDLAVIDILLNDISGIEVIKKIVENSPDTKIIALSSDKNPHNILEAIKAGANAYVLKDIPDNDLIFIIQNVAKGAFYLDYQVADIIKKNSDFILPQKKMTRAGFKAQHANLTEREYEVLKLIVDGKSNQQIADILSISEHTSKAHVCNIIQKLVVDDRTQAAVKAIKEGIV
ncbi:MAG: response regulator transcription factor [Cyanobacteria bacterium SIG30]|nr:response regulator transcription factor [Cyanobacteria bacterium SIG30]